MAVTSAGIWGTGADSQKQSGLTSAMARRVEKFKDEVYQTAIQTKSALFQKDLFASAESGTWAKRGDHFEFGPRTPFLQYMNTFAANGTSRDFLDYEFTGDEGTVASNKVTPAGSIKEKLILKTNLVRASYDKILYHSDYQHAKAVFDRQTEWYTAFDIEGDVRMKLTQAMARALDLICVDGFFDPTFVKKLTLDETSRGNFYGDANRNTPNTESSSLDTDLATMANAAAHGGVGYGYGMDVEKLLDVKNAKNVAAGYTGISVDSITAAQAKESPIIFVATGDGSDTDGEYGKVTRHTLSALKKHFRKQDIDPGEEELILTMTPELEEHLDLEEHYVSGDYGEKRLMGGGTLRHVQDYAGVTCMQIPVRPSKRITARAAGILSSVGALTSGNGENSPGAQALYKAVAKGSLSTGRSSSASTPSVVLQEDINGDKGWKAAIMFTKQALVKVIGAPGEVLTNEADIAGPYGQGEKIIYACFDYGSVRKDSQKLAVVLFKEL